MTFDIRTENNNFSIFSIHMFLTKIDEKNVKLIHIFAWAYN